MSSGVQIAIVAKQLISGRLSSFCAVAALLGPLDPGDILCLFVYMFLKKVMQGKLFLQASHY